MGRGRAKAKQQKVARELKYNSHHTDFGALQRELSHHNGDDPDLLENDDDEDDGDWIRASR